MSGELWLELNSSEIKQELQNNTVVLLPVGSCEQHGLHLPVGTDSFISENVVLKAAEIAKSKVLILPTIKFGYSPHHFGFTGTVSLAQSTLISLVKDICYSLIRQNAKKIIIVNGHGGNQSALQAAVNEVGEQYEITLVLIRYWDLISTKINQIRQTKLGGMGHAGELETSLMEYIQPDLVKEEGKRNQTNQGVPIYNPDMFAKNPIYIFRPFKDFSDIGVIGDPTLSSEEKGKKLMALVSEELSYIIDYIAGNDMKFK